MVDKITTPFGNFIVEVNDKQISFRKTLRKVKCENINVDFYDIELSTNNLKIGDKVVFKLEDCNLEYNDSDERSVLLTVENEKYILGLNGFEPQYHEDEEKYYSYILYSSENYFEYEIKDREKFTINKADLITLRLGWINKADFTDYDDAIFMILDI